MYNFLGVVVVGGGGGGGGGGGRQFTASFTCDSSWFLLWPR